MCGGKKRDKNGQMRNNISKQIGIHQHADGAPDCGLKIASPIWHPIRSKQRNVKSNYAQGEMT